MKSTKTIRVLSLFLTLLLLVSTIVVLPAVAEDTETTTAEAPTVTISAEADLFVRNNGDPATNSEKLQVKSDNQTDKTGRRAYLLFNTSEVDLTGYTVKSAKIRLFCIFANESDASYRTEYKLYATSSESGWSDDDASQYSFGKPPVTDDQKILDIDASGYEHVTKEANGYWVEFDVTDYVSANMNKQITFSLRNEGAHSNNNQLTFNSSEASSNQPQLVIETRPASDSLKPSYDLYVESNNKSANYSENETFTVKSENGSPIRRAYLMFDTAASIISDVSEVSNVKLRLYCTYASTSSKEKENRKQYRLYAFTDYTWENQADITWNTQPSSDTMELVRFIDVSSNVKDTWIEIDVTEYVKNHWGEKITFSLRNYGPSSNENHLSFSTSEAQNGNAPALSI